MMTIPHKVHTSTDHMYVYVYTYLYMCVSLPMNYHAYFFASICQLIIQPNFSDIVKRVCDWIEITNQKIEFTKC